VCQPESWILNPSARDVFQFGHCAAEGGRPTGSFPLNEGFEGLSDQGCFLGNSAELLGSGHQIVVKSEGCSHISPALAPAAQIAPKLVLAEGTDVALAFDEDISSKTASEGDPVAFVLADDLKVGNVVVAKAGSKAFGEVTNAKKSGMMGKAGELNVRLDYLKVGDVKVHLRGAKGKEGESGATGAIVLTVRANWIDQTRFQH
jgi:hypothetical protein